MSSLDSSHANILVADDDYSVLDRYRTILGVEKGSMLVEADPLDDFMASLGGEDERSSEHVHWETTLVEQGFDAVQAAQLAQQQGHRITHAFLDMRMPPGMDGLQTARRLREIDPDVEIIFVSAYFDYTPEDISRVLGQHWLFLQKPFQEQEILKLLPHE